MLLDVEAEVLQHPILMLRLCAAAVSSFFVVALLLQRARTRLVLSSRGAVKPSLICSVPG